MKNQGVLYPGLHTLGGGSILGGLILGAIAVFVIDRKFMNAAAFAFAGAVFTFFGLMHGEHIGIAVTPVVAASYLAVSVLLLGCAKFTVPVVVTEEIEEEDEEAQPA
jgi:AGZA family xanthine/uracil permease-like MFS transporter